MIVKFGADLADFSKGIKDVESQSEGVGKSLQSKFAGLTDTLKNVGVGLTVGVTAPLMALGALALKASADVGGGMKQIALQTGETGKTLESLQTSFKTVFTSVPVDAAAASEAVITLHSKLGLIGPTLDNLAIKLANLSKLTKADLPALAGQVADLSNQFGLTSEQGSAATDVIYKIAQATGQAADPAFTQLLGTIKQVTPEAKAMGFSLGETAFVVAELGKVGAPAEVFFNALNKAMMVAKKEGGDAKTIFTGWVEEIKKSSDPLATATKLMGADGLGKSAIDFVNAVKTGNLDWGKYLDLLKQSPDAINKTAEANRSFGDSMTLVKNKIETALQPLGSAINLVMTDALKDLDPVINKVGDVGKAFDQLPMSVKKTVVVIGAVAAAVGPALVTVATLGSSIAQMATAAVPMFTRIAGSVAGFAQSIILLPVTLGKIVVHAAEGVVHFAKWAIEAGKTVVHMAEIAVKHIVSIVTSAARVAGHFAESAASALSMVGSLAKTAVSMAAGAVSSAMSAGSLISSVASSLLMLGAWIIMGALFIGVAAAITAVAAYFIIALATSKTFRDTLGQLVIIAKQFAGHLSTAFSALMSGDVTKAVNEIKIGLGEAYDNLKKMDWKSIFDKIGTEMTAGIKSGLTALKSFWNDSLKPALIAGIESVDWVGVGATAGDLLKKIFTAGFGILKGIFTGDWSGLQAAISSISVSEGPELNTQVAGFATPAKPAASGLAKAAQDAFESFKSGMREGSKSYFADGEFSKDLETAIKLIGPILIKVPVKIALEVMGMSSEQAEKAVNPMQGLGKNAPGGGKTIGQQILDWILPKASAAEEGQQNTEMSGNKGTGGIPTQDITITITANLKAGTFEPPLDQIFGRGEKGAGYEFKKAVGITPGIFEAPMDQIFGRGKAAAAYEFKKAVGVTAGTFETPMDQIFGRGKEGAGYEFKKAVGVTAGTFETPMDQIFGRGEAGAGYEFKKAVGVTPGTFESPMGQIFGQNGEEFKKAVGIVKGSFEGTMGQIFGENGDEFKKAVGIVRGSFESPMGQIFGLDGSPFTKAVNIVRGSMDATLEQLVGINSEPFTKAVSFTTNISQIQTDLNNLKAPDLTVKVNYDQSGKPTTQFGAIIPSTPGGMAIIAGEAGEREAVVPESMWYRDWGSVLSSLPRFGGGGIVGGNTGMSWSTSSRPAQLQSTVQYNAYVTVDSENIKRKVFDAFRELEQYQQLR